MKKFIFAFTATMAVMISTAYADITVGTTGDYAPFSIYNPKDNKYSGKDIKLIEAFAKSKKERVKFVKTSWATAENDLKNNKFDVFVGGMTITPERQKEFVFSTPLILFNKAAMTACKKLNKYKTFSDIDNPKTLVIENRGGTNQIFAMQKLKNAKVLIISDNDQAINSIINGIDNIHPDIMFTDTLEIAYQHSKNHKICQIPVKVDDNQYYKAFMFNNTPQGKKTAQEFNNWLSSNPTILKKYINS
ncbi:MULTISPECIES: transporter substrate-binding domain-containing protein [Francisella]|uniref:Cyclohexadienyl dehydratase n=1 Tax=Francisella opportunistica TaxID=2016517 RepID=A0A345JPI5_9GAMM|nr:MULTISPECIES: transporter substrate-binding domain-containing protein [Francisella]APC90904.1 Putative extracellular solute-binding protein [Francisella sp. MA067296]AXH29231.1 cyclohexadienyl dehydratase [Francisella opportunistica]AXH30882.1 cyclohexadienyl dehydratase [Francisella opportunistica]AXH32527.1 cyclohexadienyl dehydratase [Francisella opportunistica]